MHAESSMRPWRLLTILIPFFALAGCGEGDGPIGIAGTAATPLPPGQVDPCDAGLATFEAGCPGEPSVENFGGGASDPIPNPDKSGINTSDTVQRMKKYGDQVFGGTKWNLATGLDFGEGEAFTMKVWSPRQVAVSFKLEETGNSGGGRTVEVDHSGSGAWELLCFDFTGDTASIPNPPVLGITVIFDNGELGAAVVDDPNDGWTFYYDEINQVDSCAGVGAGTPIDPDATLYVTSGAPDLVRGQDYTEETAFGSGSVIDPMYADDDTYSPVLSVFSGTGYGANIAQIGYTGFRAGFAGAYESVDFKVKGMPNFVIFVKLFDGVDSLRINLTSSDFSEALTGGWYQVSIPVSSFIGVDQATGIIFESDNSASTQFRMLLTDIGFSGTGTGGPVIADPGIIPDDVIYASDPGEMVDLVSTITAFGTSSTFDGAYALDPDFNPSFQAQSGSGYGLDHIVQLGFIGLPQGFAAAYESFNFKIKSADLPGDTIVVKLEGGGGLYGDVVLSNTAISTPLGNNWYQVVLPISGFTNVADAVGVLFERVGAQTADGGTPFSMLLTDIGFSGTANPGADPGLIPEDVVYATDPGEMVDLVTTITAFGTSSTFDGAYALDADFNPAFQAVSGSGYGLDHIVQLGFIGLPQGFATGYESFSFKIKSADLPGDTVVVKLEGGGGAYGDVALSNTAISTSLGNGWYQVVLPMADFTNVADAVGFLFERVGAQTADGGTQFSMLVTDIGFNNPTGGGGGAGIVPEDVVYATDPGEMVDLVTTITAFGTSSTFDGAYALDADYNPAFQAVSGSGYGLDHIVQLGFIGLTQGFATGYETFSFKIKSADLPGDTVVVKLEGGGGAYGDVALSNTAISTSLGNGWYQVVLPMADFTNVADAVGFLFERVGAQTADGGTQFSMLITDIGFNNASGGGGGGGGGAGEIAVNGGFESGDFTGWTQFEATPGDQTVNTGMAGDTSSEGTFHLEIDNTAAGTNSLIKQERVGFGTVTPGIPWTVTFDARGSLGPGGVAFAQVFSETAGGSENCTGCGILGSAPLTLDADPAVWTSFTFSGTAGSNTESLTLQLEAVTGGAGSFANMFYDNISIVVN